MSFTAYYDLMANPTSYDVVSFLMLTERERIKRTAETVAIEILPGPNDGFRADHLWPYTTWDRRHILNSVVVPMCELLPSCERVVMQGSRVERADRSIGHGEYTISFKEFCDSYALGIRPLRAKKLLHPGRMAVTMTLRECDHWPERNSHLAVWVEAAHLLSKRYKVIVVRDTAKAYATLAPLEIAPAASCYLMDRAELYASSALNLFVNNGPAWLSLALDAPTVVFRPITETKCYAHCAEAMAKFGVPMNGQMRGHPPHQYLCWQEETVDNIVNEVDKFVRQMRLEAAE